MQKLLLASLLVACAITFTTGYIQPPQDGFLKREFSLSKPYSGNGLTMPYWDFRDFVMISNSYVRLTRESPSQKGSIWSKEPCYMHDWEMHVQFKIHGSGKTLAADGMAFWYTRTKMVPGSVFGSKDEFEGLGVFLDTYKNGNQPVSFPQVSAMIGNGSMKYDHANDGKEHSIGNCLSALRNKRHDTYMKIRYNKEVLTIAFDVHDDAEWKDCVRVEGVRLPTQYFFGFSAATGDLSDNHEIKSVKLYELNSQRTPEDPDEDWASVIPSVALKSPIDNADEDGQGAYRNNSPGGMNLFLMILLIAIGLGVCSFVGYFVYQKHKENKSKRFY